VVTIPHSQAALIYWDHFEHAVTKTLQQRGALVTPELLEVMIHNHHHFFRVEMRDFGQSIRMALTASCIRIKHRRVLYSTALSLYYSPRAILGAKRARVGAHKRNRVIPKPPRVIQEVSDQYSLVL